MEVTNEQLRRDFSARLSAELARVGLSSASPTQVARVFNQRFPDHAVTPQTVRKWLQADAIPVQSKLLALSEWFACSAEWLRYGTGERVANATAFLSSPRGGILVVGTENARIQEAVTLLLKLSLRDLQLVEGMMHLMLAADK